MALSGRRSEAAWIAALFVFAAFQAFAVEEPKLPCSYDDKECALKANRAHVTKKIGFWRAALAKPVDERVGVAPRELIELLALDNIYHGYPERPHASSVDAEFLADARDAVAEIPGPVKRLIGDTLAGIYFVDDFGGTGFTDVVYDSEGKPVAGFIVVDPSILRRRTANAWATWKDNTPFKPDRGFTLTATIETPPNDIRKNAIQYILLHEIAHVVSVKGNFHPSWELAPKEVGSTAQFPYFELSWAVSRSDNRYVTIFDDAFPQRRSVAYYFGAKLTAAEMRSTYENLEKTSFATLYAATSPGDDFAEAFASYVHTVLMGKPFAIRIEESGKPALIFESCWTKARCAKKRKMLEDLLATGQ